jgi:acetoin utilization protein AcuA
MEVKAVEVSRDWRGSGIGRSLVSGILEHPDTEDHILYFVGYTWTWDLEGSKLSASKYRDMMYNLFKSQCFAEYKTNEPNVCLDPNNLFMCRIGKHITEEVLEQFKWLRFGINP